MATVEIEIEDLTNRQLHLLLVGLLTEQAEFNYRMEVSMSALTESVASIQAATDTIAVRFASYNQVTLDALEAAKSELSALKGVSEADKQTILDLVEEASEAAESLNSDVAELNAIGAEPDVPVEPVPVEEMPPPPSEETPPPAEEAEEELVVESSGPPQEIPPNEESPVTPG